MIGQPKTLAFTEQDAVQLAWGLYGLRVGARKLPGEYDDNFHLASDSGDEFILKIMHADQQRAVVDMQCQALLHLAERAPALALPRVHPTLAGEIIATTTAPDGASRLVWLLSYVPGHVLANANPHSHELLFSLGQLLGQLDAALAGFDHATARRELKWDMTRALWARDYLAHIQDPARRALAERYLALYEAEVLPLLPALRTSVIHGDANDYNVLVSAPGFGPRQVVSVIDFGDMHHTITIAEVAVAAAYALLGKRDPLAAAAQVVAGYHRAFPLHENEIALLYPLICARLSVSVTNSAYRATLEPDDPYIKISEQPAWSALEQLAGIHPRFAHYTFRHACGLDPVPHSAAVVRWLAEQAGQLAPVIDLDPRTTPSHVFDLSVSSLLLGADPRNLETRTLEELLDRELREAGVELGIGRYDEARLLYSSPAFESGSHPTDERRTIHLGIDLWVPAGAPIYRPAGWHGGSAGQQRGQQGLRPAGDPATRQRHRPAVLHALWAPQRRHTGWPTAWGRRWRMASASARSVRRRSTATGRRTCTSRSLWICSTWTATSPALRSPASARSGPASRPTRMSSWASRRSASPRPSRLRPRR